MVDLLDVWPFELIPFVRITDPEHASNLSQYGWSANAKQLNVKKLARREEKGLPFVTEDKISQRTSCCSGFS